MIPDCTTITATFNGSTYVVFVGYDGVETIRVNNNFGERETDPDLPWWPNIDAFMACVPSGTEVIFKFPGPKNYGQIQTDMVAEGLSWPEIHAAMTKIFNAHCANLGQAHGLTIKENANPLTHCFTYKGVTPLMGL